MFQPLHWLADANIAALAAALFLLMLAALELCYRLGRNAVLAAPAGEGLKTATGIVTAGMLGLFAFFYGCLHAACYAWLDMGLDLALILPDIAKRNFILVGTAALLLMLPLALTSFNRAIRALGPTRWQALHRAVYVVALLALLHFFWMRAGKNDFAEVAVYATVIAALLAWRLWWRWRAGVSG
jgi:DMSO/TMAO reductase YedYZ heme-binding membrane subunit